MSCVFCKIISKEIPAEIIYEDSDILAFPDVRPKYKTHVLLITKKHLASVSESGAEDDAALGKLLRVGAELAKKTGIAEDGFRLLTNTGKNAGQAVSHIHVHLLGGEKLRNI